VIPRELRTKIKPWRQTVENEIRRALTLVENDKVIAAALLGIGKTTIYRRLEKSSTRRVARKSPGSARSRSRAGAR
jgi:transcriptional regulator with PAS, ATPase and Fis domain